MFTLVGDDDPPAGGLGIPYLFCVVKLLWSKTKILKLKEKLLNACRIRFFG